QRRPAGNSCRPRVQCLIAWRNSRARHKTPIANGHRGGDMPRLIVLASLALIALFAPANAFPAAPTHADGPFRWIDFHGQHFDLKMNVYLPSRAAGAPTPMVLSIHGKGGNYNTPKTYALNLVDHGIAVATIDFRKADMPGMLYDCKAYIRFIRAHA